MIVADEVMLNEVKKEVDIMASNALCKFPETPRSSSLRSEYYEATQTSSISLIPPGIACQMDATKATSLWSIVQVSPFSLRHRPESTYGHFMCSSTYCEAIKVAETYISTGLSGHPPEYLVPDRRSVQICLDTVPRVRRIPLCCSLFTPHPLPWLPLSTAEPRAVPKSHSCNRIPDIFALL